MVLRVNFIAGKSLKRGGCFVRAELYLRGYGKTRLKAGRNLLRLAGVDGRVSRSAALPLASRPLSGHKLFVLDLFFCVLEMPSSSAFKKIDLSN